VKLATDIIGDIPVANIQTQDEIEYRYEEKIRMAHNDFEKEVYPEARAHYMIASEIKPDDIYPKNQVIAIDGILKDESFQSNFATIPENDKSRMIVPQLIDSAQYLNPSAPIAASKPEPMKPAPTKQVTTTGMEARDQAIASGQNPDALANRHRLPVLH
jgi:hypothetical protein